MGKSKGRPIDNRFRRTLEAMGCVDYHQHEHKGSTIHSGRTAGGVGIHLAERGGALLDVELFGDAVQHDEEQYAALVRETFAGTK